MYLRLRAEHICIRYFVLRICVYCHLYCDMILLEGSSCLAKILGGSFQGKTSRLTISSSLLCWRVNDVYFFTRVCVFVAEFQGDAGATY